MADTDQSAATARVVGAWLEVEFIVDVGQGGPPLLTHAWRNKSPHVTVSQTAGSFRAASMKDNRRAA
jgi:hypothetical protein